VVLAARVGPNKRVGDILIEAEARATLKLDQQTIDSLTALDFETVTIDVFYFDPVANARKKLTRKVRYKHVVEG
jgi:hypothetical protein